MRIEFKNHCGEVYGYAEIEENTEAGDYACVDLFNQLTDTRVSLVLTHDELLTFGKALIRATGAEVDDDGDQDEDEDEDTNPVSDRAVFDHLLQWVAGVALKVDGLTRDVGSVSERIDFANERIDTTRAVLSKGLGILCDKVEENEEIQEAIGHDIETLWAKVDPYDKNPELEENDEETHATLPYRSLFDQIFGG